MRLHFGRGHLDSNHHVMRKIPFGGRLDGMTHTFHVMRGPRLSVVPLGRDGFHIVDGRLFIGRRLYFYAPSGQCWNWDVGLRFDRSPYAEGHRYGPRPDYTPTEAIQL